MGTNPVAQQAFSGPDVITVATRRPPEGVPKYEFAQLHLRLKNDLHLINTAELAQWLSLVVAVESPVHWIEAARRVANAGGVQRIGNRINDAFKRACRRGGSAGLFAIRNGFLWKSGDRDPVVRDRSDFPSLKKKIEYVAPEEIALAIERVVRDSYGMGTEEIASATCRLLGFARVTEEMRTVVEQQRDSLISSGRLVMKGGLLVCAAEGNAQR
jgi:hypothetical protein